MSAAPTCPQSGLSTHVRVLVVDDSAVTLQTVSNFLRRQAAVEVVGTAQDGAEAVELAKKLQPDLVLMDVQMPGMNGLEATAEILRQQPGIRVVMITVNDTPELRQAAKETGAYQFIPKPQLWRTLPDMLRELKAELEQS
jgi:two-component system chemotaxis response regulator CheB